MTKEQKEIIDRLERIEQAIEMKHDKILPHAEAAKYLGIKRSYLYKLTSKKQIPYLQPGGKLVYFRQSELDQWLLQHPVASQAQIEQKIWKQRGGR